jgi:hypothetical protein
MNKDIFINSKNILNYFRDIFEKYSLSKSDKSTLFLFLFEKLKNIYKIIYKNKDFLIKIGIPLDEHFFILFHNIFHKKQKGGLKLLINNRDIYNYIIIKKDINEDINQQIIIFYKNICNLLIYLSKKEEIDLINNIITDLQNNKDIDKEFIIYFRLFLTKNIYNNSKKKIINNYLTHTFLNKNIANLIDIFGKLDKKVNNNLFLYFKFLLDIFSNNILNKKIFLMIIIYGIITLENSIIKIFKQKNNNNMYIRFIIFYTIFYISILKIII